MCGVKICACIKITDSLQRSCFLLHAAEMSGTHKVVVSNNFFLYLCILLRWASLEHTDTTVGCVVSVESVHVDPAETDLATICTYSLLWRPGMWLKINQRPAIIWRCCSSFRGAAEITSLCWLYYTGGATDVIHHQAIWDVKVLWIMHVFWLLCLFSNRKPLKSWCSTNIAFLFFFFFLILFCSCSAGSVLSVVRAAWQETSMSGCKDKLSYWQKYCRHITELVLSSLGVWYHAKIETTELKQKNSDFAPLHNRCTSAVKKKWGEKQHLVEIWLGAHLQ